MMALRKDDDDAWQRVDSAWLQEARRCYWHAQRGNASGPYEQLSWWYIMRHVGMVQGSAL